MPPPLTRRLIQEPFTQNREAKQLSLEADLAITGGGLAGTCAAIAAAREGLKVILIQDRPVLGGNASSEVRLWMLGATSHMGNNNRWARESGVVGEILVENLYRNPEGNPLIVDALLLEKVDAEPNLTLLLNTAVFDLEKSTAKRISSLQAFCSQNSTRYTIKSSLFMDCSGDGIVGFLAGAAFRMGAESREEFDEKFAPDEDFGYLLGHSLYFYSKGVYPIPLAATLSANIENLAFGGRIISSSHVAFGSTRVMLTCAYTAQATAIALAYASREALSLCELLSPKSIGQIQLHAQRQGQHIPHLPFLDSEDKTLEAELSATSSYRLQSFPADGPGQKLDHSIGMLLPFQEGPVPAFQLQVEAEKATTLTLQLRFSEKTGNTTPDAILEEIKVSLEAGSQTIQVEFSKVFPRQDYGFICFLRNPAVTLADSHTRITGVLSVSNSKNPHVSNSGAQVPEKDIGVESFEFWCPQRRPEGRNLALQFEKPVTTFRPELLRSGYERPFITPNAWAADLSDPEPALTLSWKQPLTLSRIVIALDTDFDHPMESVLWSHPENCSPFCVRDLEVFDDAAQVVASTSDNHQTYIQFVFDQPIQTTTLTFKPKHPAKNILAALFAVHTYGEPS